MSKKIKIVVIGAGFGGIKFIKSFYKKPVEVLLIDKNNYHNFQPLMYQVATGGLEAGSIAYPVRRIFRNYKNVSFRMAEVFAVTLSQNKITTSIGEIDFDFLVIASGSKNKYFNFESIKHKLLTLKSLPEALLIRNRIFQNMERTLANNRTESIEEIMNIAIVGGGPSGIELAGALAEMRRHIIPNEFPSLPLDKMNVNLYQAGPELLAGMSREASAATLKYLKELEVNVFLNTRVEEYGDKYIRMNDGSTFITDTVIWTAGVQGSPIKGIPEESIISGNRISVDDFNKVEGMENIFAIGDVSAHISSDEPKGLPMLAPVAQQQGKHLAKNILRLLDGKPMKPFMYRNRGVMATIGRKKAVVDLPKYKFQGAFAWFLWMFFHIFSLVGFRDKTVVFIDWAANYFSYDQPSGMILSTALKKEETIKEREKIKKTAEVKYYGNK